MQTGHCDGACPKGLPVSDLVRFAMYADGYGEYGMGRMRFDRLPAHVRSVRCERCRVCTVECPNGVSVRERAIRARNLFA